MKISIIHEPDVSETEITVKYGYLDSKLEQILAYISMADNRIAGTLGGETHFINISDILYFESVDRRVFFYTEGNCFETKSKMYEIEEKLTNTPFARVSKSTIANLQKVRMITVEKHSKLCATLINGEKVIVSRQYLGIVKGKLGV